MSVKRTKAQQRDATRAALISVARDLFAQRGFAAVGTEEIVRAAGVTRGALYHHFESKEGLFAAVLEVVSADLSQRLAGELIAIEDPFEALVTGAERFLELSATSLEVQRILLIDGPSVLGWEAWRASDLSHGLGLVEFALARAIEAGAIAPAPLRPLTHVLVGALDEAAMLVARAEDPGAARSEVSAVLVALLEGLRPR